MREKYCWYKKLSGIVISLVFVLFPMVLFAGDAAVFKEYYTYGGTAHIIADAFQRIGLIISSSVYQGLFFGIIVLSFVFGGFGVVIRNVSKLSIAPGEWVKWFFTILVSVIIYIVFVSQTDTMFIYDNTTNTTHSVGGVPDGIITVAGLANRLESEMIDLIDTSSLTGFTYADSAGGMVLSVLYNVISGGEIPISGWNNHSRRSFESYIENCVNWEIENPDARITFNDLENPGVLAKASGKDCTNDLACVIEEASRWNAIYTQWYSDASPDGVSVTCPTAWNGGGAVQGLDNIFNSISVNEDLFLKASCSGAGFDVNNGAHLNMCKSLLLNSMNKLMSGMTWGMLPSGGLETSGAIPGISNILKNRIISEGIFDYLKNSDWGTRTRAEINQRQISMGIGAGIAASDYVPLMKAIIIAIFMGMLPLLLLLIPTPLFGKVLGVICGGFCFLSFWGVADAVVNSLGMDYAAQQFNKSFNGENLGTINTLFFAPTALLKSMAAFGYMRTSAVMLAGAFSAILFKFGGYMLGSFVGGAMGHIKSAGKAEGYQTLRDTGADMKAAVESARGAEFSSEVVAASGGFRRFVGGAVQRDVFSTSHGIHEAQSVVDSATRDAGHGIGAFEAGNITGRAMGRGAWMGAHETEGKHEARSQEPGTIADNSLDVGRQQTMSNDAAHIVAAERGLGFDDHYRGVGEKITGASEANIDYLEQAAKERGTDVYGLMKHTGIGNAADDTARSDYARQHGFDSMVEQATFSRQQGMATWDSQKAFDDISRNGLLSSETVGAIHTLNSTEEGRAAFAKNARIEGYIGSPEARDNVKEWLEAHGKDTRGIEVGKHVAIGLGYNENAGVFATNVDSTDMVTDKGGVEQSIGVAVRGRGNEYALPTGTGSIVGNQEIKGDNLVTTRGTLRNSDGSVGGMVTMEETDGNVIGMKFESNGSALAAARLGNAPTETLDKLDNSAINMQYASVLGDDMKGIIDANQTYLNNHKFQETAGLKASMIAHAGVEWSDDKINQAKTGHDVYKTAVTSIMENDNLTFAEKAYGIKMATNTMMDWIKEAGSEGKAGELADASVNGPGTSILEQQRSEGRGVGINRAGKDSTLVVGNITDGIVDEFTPKRMSEKTADEHNELNMEQRERENRDRWAMGEDPRKITPDD